MTKLAPVLVLSALMATVSPLAVQAQTAPTIDPARASEATTLSLSAFGETRLTPDEATITLGSQAKAATAAEAMRSDADQMNRVIAALRGAGLAERDIQTSEISLSAQYDYPQNLPPRLTGYEADNQVTITVADLAKLGPTLDAVVAAGANQVNGISFGLKDPAAAEDAARLAAVKALRAKADLYAKATGYRILRLVNLSEGGGYAPAPIRPMAMARMSADAAMPVSPGQLTVRVDVSGVYELGQ
jgi:uncharacterized protein YggE